VSSPGDVPELIESVAITEITYGAPIDQRLLDRP
jgi:hypothetical protein